MAAPYGIICHDFLNAVMMYVMCYEIKLNFESPLIELKKREAVFNTAKMIIHI
jgi:hypothetical protein